MTEHHRNSGITRSHNIDSETTVTGGSPRYAPAETSEVRRGGRFWNRFCLCFCCCHNRGCCCCHQNEQTRPYWIQQCHAVTKSIVWKILYSFFSLFLLFGSPIQELTVDVSGDIVFSVVRNIMLAYFLLDMMARCITDRDYFVCTVRGGLMNPTTLTSAPLSGSHGGGGARHKMSYLDAKEMHTPCIIGSFLFWCDLISTLAILYDLKYINPNMNGVQEVRIELDGDGIPHSGFDTYMRLRPVELEFGLLIVIARSTRCARFVQHRAVVATSNKINWFWVTQYLKWLNPCLYYQKFRRNLYLSRSSSTGVAGGEPGNFAADGSREKIEDNKKQTRGMMQGGILAAVNAQAEAEARDSDLAGGSSSRGVWGNTRRVMQFLGIMSSERTVAEKHQAASKIQRAWRQYIRNEGAMSINGDFDLMMTEGDSLTRSRHRSSAASNAKQQNLGRMGASEELRSRGRNSMTPESRFQSQAGKGKESQVGSDMRELTGQRVAIGTLFALLCSVVFTYTEASTSWPTTMIVLHTQTQYSDFQVRALNSAVKTSVPKLFQYQPVDGSMIQIQGAGVVEGDLRERDVLMISVQGTDGTSVGWFDFSADTKRIAIVYIVATCFIILFWFVGVTAFSGPVMLLVITPIERMVRLLGMLMLDPLGYQSTSRFKRFLSEEDDIIKNTRWTKEVLKGMETSFLMSTILRIGSLMKVGFGSAGVEIIRNNLQKGQSKNSFILNSQGSTVSCIFLFCDIRQFTDATESLQEEVFVFTNRIAAVVHSICHSYGGAANKNVGDAFLLSWLLEDSTTGTSNSSERSSALRAKSNQADKALLSVIKISISLYFDKFYLEPLTETAKGRLKSKLKNRTGPVVQMGFGLHAGKAVQGAIGSPRKIDATYVSEAVERAEFLEASTKKYDLQMLMSGSFHALLHPNTRRRCRVVDKVFIVDEDEDADEDDDELHGERMDIYTFDMDIEAIHRPQGRSLQKIGDHDAMSEVGSTSGGDGTRIVRYNKRGDRRAYGSSRQIRNRRRSSIATRPGSNASEDFNVSGGGVGANASDGGYGAHASTGQGSISSMPSEGNGSNFSPPELVLPTGPALYSHNVWQSPDMKRIRDKYVQGLFFQKFHDGLQAFYSKDWETAKVCFQQVLDCVEDGPSRYFLEQMKLNNGVPPRDFRGYGVV